MKLLKIAKCKMQKCAVTNKVDEGVHLNKIQPLNSYYSYPSNLEEFFTQ